MMKILEKFTCICPFCLDEHEILLVDIEEKTTIKNENVIFHPNYYYCNKADEYFEDEELIKINQLKLIDAYEKIVNEVEKDEN